jgi:hypothetical protein
MESQRKTWEERFDELVKFKKLNGHSNVSYNTKDKVLLSLAYWVSRMRKLHKNKKKLLTKKHITKLNGIGFKWTMVDEHGKAIRANISNEELLKDLKKLHSKLGRPPTVYEIGKKGRYGNGIYGNRFGSFHNAIREAGLDTFDEALWKKRFLALKEFMKVNKRIPSKSDEGYTFLFSWCTRQRNIKEQGKMHPERIRLLDNLGFPWNIHNEKWETNFTKLKKYKTIFGHCNVAYTIKNKKYYELGYWVYLQRRHYHANELTTERLEKLNKLGFDWKR